jgi:hypothetical protein
MMTAEDIRVALNDATEISEVLVLRDAAVSLSIAAADADDIENFRLGLQLKVICERHGGALLLQMVKLSGKLPVAKLGVANCSQYWKELAALSDAEFATKIGKLAVRNLPSQVKDKKRAVPPGPVVTRLTAWQTDADGVKTRCLIAEGVTPPLKGERADVRGDRMP